jgi:GNAT superfamily N-acetyltransferase
MERGSASEVDRVQALIPLVAGTYGSRRCAVSELRFSPVGEDEQAIALANLVLAFAADPVERWLYPQPDTYLGSFRRFLVAFGGRAFEEQTAWKIGACSAVALWLPPGAEPDGDSLVATLTDSVAPDQHDVMFAVLDQMEEAHPTYPHWYLPWLGVDPAMQGRGLGTQLMKPCLEVVDQTHLPAYLETPNPRTIPFYERLGFKVTGEAQAGSCPPITCMLRQAR